MKGCLRVAAAACMAALVTAGSAPATAQPANEEREPREEPADASTAPASEPVPLPEERATAEPPARGRTADADAGSRFVDPGRPGPADDPYGAPLRREPVHDIGGLPQPSAADVRDAPRPHQVSGIVAGSPDPSQAVLWVPRALLFAPRMAAMLVFAPVRGAAYVSDEYQLKRRYLDIFFTADRRAGILPLANLDSDFGVSAGVQAVHRDLFGQRERAQVSAVYGGRFRQAYELEVDSGLRFGRYRLGFDTGYEVKPKEKFFGIGNEDEVAVGEAPEPLDPLTSDAAVETRYRQRTVHAAAGVDVLLPRDLTVEISSGFRWHRFGPPSHLSSDDVAIGDVYMTDALVGFEDQLTNLYSEIALRYDTRSNPNPYQSFAMPATGWLLAGFAGYARGIDEDPSNYIRYGVDVQRFFDLYRGTRVLGLRLMLEGVDGSYDEIPFVDLPSIGGTQFLRGYDTDRFRDRLVGVASAEYMIDISEYLSGFFFTDVGRPWSSWSDLSLDDPRLGFGVGLQGHTAEAYILRGQIASSLDGGLFLSLALQPTWEPREPLPEP